MEHITVTKAELVDILRRWDRDGDALPANSRDYEDFAENEIKQRSVGE